MPRLIDMSAEDLQRMLELLSGADSVELKLTLLESRRTAVARALGIDALDAQIRQVFFFDTPDLDLNAAGVVVRARRRQNETGDTVVKIRPVDPVDLPDEMRHDPAFGVEVDAMPGGYVCSASFKGAADNDEIGSSSPRESRRSGSCSPRRNERSTKSTPLMGLSWKVSRFSAPSPHSG